MFNHTSLFKKLHFYLPVQQGKYSYFFIFVAFFIITLGVYLRAYHYILNRSLWVDEAMLALNIVHRTFIGLTHPLSYDQGAPLGFLFAEKIIILLFGNQEYTLRLIPFLAGLSSLFLMYKATIKYVGIHATPIAMGLFAFSSPLIYYASEVKQYSSDAFVTIILLIVAFNCFQQKANRRNLIALGAVGSLALWVSHPALFVLAGIGCTLALDALLEKDKCRYILVLCIGVLWLLNFGLIYFISLRFLARNDVLINCWTYALMPMPPWQNFHWFYDRFKHLLYFTIGSGSLYMIKISGLLFLIGLCSLFVRRWQFALIMTITLITMLLISGFQKYPVTGRFLLYFVPVAIFLIAEGIERIYLVLSKCHYFIAFCGWLIVGGLLITTPVQTSYLKFRNHNMKEDIKPVLSYLKKHRKHSDIIYVYYGAWPALEYYAPRYDITKTDYIKGISSRQNPEGYLKDIYKLKGHERVWFLFSHDFSASRHSIGERYYITEHLKKIGTRVNGFKADGCAVYLYDLTSPDMGHEIKPALLYLAKHKKPTDFIYVYYGALGAFDYYGPSYGLQQDNRIAGIQSRQHPEKYINDIDKLKGNRRVWFVFYHDYARNRHVVSEKTYYLRHLNKIGFNKEKLEKPRCAVYLFDLTK